ncbi:hypothetical protein F4561_004214 [Lipingzhangella halophila]|uniref:Uncharacterized protein n=1 Tax=Lipingzhangella halophila TaxID=1783352 RepID=A0A7W7RJZ0_9ACTN|nr:hypothetical protein [Lipingzhangella halophila]MBB4933394.1 hypothetical protein [Lipingzhangella halophila]
MTAESYTVDDLADLHEWAHAMDAAIAVVDEDWQSVTYEAGTTVGGERVSRRCRHTLPMGTALRRWERTYVIGLRHTTRDGGQCHHVRQVIAPCLNGPEERARRLAITIVGALVEYDRRKVCGATAANLRTYVAERAADWRSG